MSISLYDVHEMVEKALSEAEQYAAEHDGEIPEDLAMKLDGLELAREGKVAHMCRAFKNLKAEREAVQKEAERLVRRVKSLETREQWIRNYLQVCLNRGEKFKDTVVSLFWKFTEAVQVNDAEQIPEMYKVRTESTRVDKGYIKDELKAGKSIAGVELVKNATIIIR